MTTNELIELLKQEDPKGNATVCIGNMPINFIEGLPGYYDGRLQVIEYDEKGEIPKRIKIVSKGMKVKIHYLDIEQMIYDYPFLPVVTDNGKNDPYYVNAYDDARKDALNPSGGFREYALGDWYNGMLGIWNKEKIP